MLRKGKVLGHAWQVQRTPFERLIMITNVLTEAGENGRSALALADSIGHVGTSDSKRDQLARDIRALRRAGIEISNVSALGEEARWVLRPQDSRVRLAFSDEERAELARAALLASEQRRDRLLAQVGPDGVPALDPAVAVQATPPPQELDLLLHAVTSRCQITFTYSGKERRVDPAEVEHGPSEWWLRGWEHDAGRTKTFTVSRMSDLQVALPGTAERRGGADHPSPDPLTWRVDEPIEARITCSGEYEAEVRSLLNAGGADLTDSVEDSHEVEVRVTVTNRYLFLARIIELGARVRLAGPPELRDELRARLTAVIQ